MTEAQRQLVVQTWKGLDAPEERFGEVILMALFERAGKRRALFPEDLGDAARRLATMLSFVAGSLDWPGDAWRDQVPKEQDLFVVLLALGRRHATSYGVPVEAHAEMKQAVLAALGERVEGFGDEAQAAWGTLLDVIGTLMMLGRSASVDLDMGRVA